MTICVKRTKRNFNPNTNVIINEVIDELNRYNPQPTSRTDLLLNVINERIPFIDPTHTNKIVTARLILR